MSVLGAAGAVMTMGELAALAMACAPLVAPDTALALIKVESSGNPFAIGVVGGALVRQPTHLAEAVATAHALEAAGWNYSVGLGQINKRNFKRYGLTAESAFQPCANLAAMQGILGECFSRASRGSRAGRTDARPEPQVALRNAFSCYYSGNFLTGHRHGYVRKVVAAWSRLPAVAEGRAVSLSRPAPDAAASSTHLSPRLTAAGFSATTAGALP